MGEMIEEGHMFVHDHIVIVSNFGQSWGVPSTTKTGKKLKTDICRNIKD
jgi:hypothetical protein